ncbi:MAG: hypothetical protein ACYS1A_20020 [Planctomycetota bacterium]|jgi:hypothetical protein
MDVIKVKDCIEKLIVEIGKTRREIEDKGRDKAVATSDYDRKLAVTLAELRNGEFYKLAGKQYPVPPVTIMEKIAKGICAPDRYDLEVAESAYKACISNLEALKAQLNGYQSVYKHLESV